MTDKKRKRISKKIRKVKFSIRLMFKEKKNQTPRSIVFRVP